MKICVKCQKEIKEKDSWIDLNEFIAGKKNREESWHIDCFKDRDKDNVKKMAMGLAARANKLMAKAEEHIS